MASNAQNNKNQNEKKKTSHTLNYTVEGILFTKPHLVYVKYQTLFHIVQITVAAF